MGRWIKGSLLSVAASPRGLRGGNWRVKNKKSAAVPSERSPGHRVDAGIEEPQRMVARIRQLALFRPSCSVYTGLGVAT